MKRFVGLALLALPVASFFSCAPKPSVKLVFLDPCGTFRSSAAFTELAVFNNSCPSQQDLVAGKTSGAVFDAVRPADATLPAVGNLKENKYGFAVVLRDASCGVIGFGCTEADLHTIREVRIQVEAWGTSSVCTPLKGAGCPAPTSCVAGRCESEAGTGGQCDLGLVTSGSLPDVSVNQPQVTGPALAPVTSGFVIGYRSQSTLDNTVRGVSILLSDGGQLGTPSTQSLAGCLSSNEPTDGVGLAFPFQGGNGLMLFSLQNCSGGGAGAFFVPVHPDATLGTPVGLSQPTYQELDLARVHSLAAAPTSNEYTTVFHVLTTDTPPLNETKIASLAGTGFKSGSSVNSILSGDPHSDFAMVAATSQVRGVLVDNVDTAKSYLQVTPQGATAGDAGPGGADGGPGQGGYQLPGSPWGAITAWGNRVAGLVPGRNVPSTALTVQVVGAQASVGTAMITGQFLGADVAEQGDHVIVVGSYVSQLTLYRLDGAQAGAFSTTPVVTVPFQGKIGGVSLSSFDGARVAIAAHNNRVAVVWINTLKPQGASPGGWALFSCQ